jgi:hypothetical protein
MADRSTFDNPLNPDDGVEGRRGSQTFDMEAPAPERIQRPLTTGTSISKDFRSVDGEQATIDEVIVLFRRVAGDEDELDRAGLAQVMRTLNKPSEPDEIDRFFAEIGGDDETVTLEAFVPWYQAAGTFALTTKKDQNFKQAGAGAAKVGQKVLKPVAKVKKAIQGSETEVMGRGVAPESMFLIDANGNADMREKADLSARMHMQYERDFHQIRDMLSGQENDTNFQECFDDANAALFDAKAGEKALGWPTACIEAARRVFARKEQENLWRHFVQSNPVLGGKAGTLVFGVSIGKETSASSAPTPRAAEHAAAAFLASADGSLEMIIDSETLPFERAFQAVCEALQQELSFRAAKVSELEERLAEMNAVRSSVIDRALYPAQNGGGEAETPRKLRISGLRGDAAIANGIYCVEGLRCFWGRPLYSRLPDNAGDSTAVSGLHSNVDLLPVCALTVQLSAVRHSHFTCSSQRHTLPLKHCRTVQVPAIDGWTVCGYWDQR